MIMLLNATSFLLLLSDFHSILEVELVVKSLFSIFFTTQDRTNNTGVFEKPLKHTYTSLWALMA